MGVANQYLWDRVDLASSIAHLVGNGYKTSKNPGPVVDLSIRGKSSVIVIGGEVGQNGWNLRIVLEPP